MVLFVLKLSMPGVYRMFTVIYFIYLLNNFSHMLLTMNAICVVLCIATECQNSLPRLCSGRVSQCFTRSCFIILLYDLISHRCRRRPDCFRTQEVLSVTYFRFKFPIFCLPL